MNQFQTWPTWKFLIPNGPKYLASFNRQAIPFCTPEVFTEVFAMSFARQTVELRARQGHQAKGHRLCWIGNRVPGELRVGWDFQIRVSRGYFFRGIRE